MSLPELVELLGAPLERGANHGKQMKDQIHACYQSLRDAVLLQPAAQRRGVKSEADLLAFCERYKAPSKAYNSDLFEEMEGIAEGADIALDKVMVLNLNLELIDLTNAKAPDPPTEVEGGCTTLGVELPHGRGCIVAQTYDLQVFYEDAAIRFRSKTANGQVDGLSCA